ncbi:MAG TPA: ABC transporter permease subunit [Micromonosporaceae bacterium]
MRKHRRISGMAIATTVAAVGIVLLLGVPLVVQLITALRGPFLPFGLDGTRWGFADFRQLYALRKDFAATIGTTALFVGGAGVISIGIAWVLAWLVVRTDIPGRNAISVLVVVPYIIPPIVKAQGFLLMLAPHTGVLNQLLRLLPFVGGQTGPINPFSFGSLVVVQGLASVTFPFLMFIPILSNMDGSLEEAARTSGASWSRTIRRVTLPILWPSTLGVIALSLILLLGTLEVPLLFGEQSGRNIFALKIWNLINSAGGGLPQYGLAAVWGLHFLVFTSLLFLLYLRATRDAERRASVSGKGFRPSRMELGRWRRPGFAGVVLFLVLTAALPLLALLWASLTPYPIGFSWHNLSTLATGSAYGAVLADPGFWQSLEHTLIIAVGSATIAVVLSAVLAYSIARGKRSRGNRLLDLLASSSVALPATIAGFAFFLLFLVVNRWIPLNGTVFALVLAYSYRVSIPYRTTYSATLQIKKELEEAASTSGASRLTAFRRIVLPLLLPSMAAVWIQLFILGANEFTLPAFLATPASEPLSMYVYEHINPQAASIYAPNQGAAMAMIFTLLVLAVGYGLQFAMSRRTLARSANGGGRSTRLAAVGPAAFDPVGGLEAPEPDIAVGALAGAAP